MAGIGHSHCALIQLPTQKRLQRLSEMAVWQVRLFEVRHDSVIPPSPHSPFSNNDRAHSHPWDTSQPCFGTSFNNNGDEEWRKSHSREFPT